MVFSEKSIIQQNVDRAEEELEKMLPSTNTDEQNPKIMVEKKKCWKERSWLDKLSYIKNNITVEPLLACYIIPSALAALAIQNLFLEKACRVNLGFSSTVCDALRLRDTANYTREEKLVQQTVASMASWKTIIQSALPCSLILFWGSWSDRHGRRKPCILIPIIGEILTAIGMMLCTYFDRVPMEVAGVTDSLFPGLTGGWCTTFMGVFSYIADVTTEEDRTLRIGIVNLIVSLSIPLGMAFSGILLKQIGFYGIFSICFCMYSFAFFYGLFYLKEPNKKLVSIKEKLKDDNQKQKSVIADFFDKSNLVDTFKLVFKKGPNQRRLRVIMLIVVVMVVVGPMHGEMSVFYLFARLRFNWNEVQFSFFSTYAMMTSLIGTMLSVGVLSHLLKVDDAMIGVISSMSKIISSFVYAFAVTDWQIYLGPIAEILNGTSFIAMRSIASKLVGSAEIGKVNSFFGVAEALMPLIYAPMYATVYTATINILPGMFFLLGGALTFPAVLIFLWMYRVHKKEHKSKTLQKEQEQKNEQNVPGDGVVDMKNGMIKTLSGIVDEKKNGDIPVNRSDDNVQPNEEITIEKQQTNECEQHCNDNIDNILHETVEIVKELPALHLEHCKL